MRIICPSCDAQYEIGEALIPGGGREVQCSNCSAIWFEGGAEADAPAEEEEVAPAKPDDAPIRREAARPDEATLAILREERAREDRFRAEEADRDAQADPKREAAAGERQRLAEAARRARGRDVHETRAAPSFDPAVQSGRADASAGDRFQDVDSVSTELTPQETEETRETEPSPPRDGRRAGFRWGFGLVAATALAAVLVYLFAAPIGARLPELAPALGEYVSFVDARRRALEVSVDALTARIAPVEG